MPNYVWTVKNQYGEKQVREVAADTVEQSKAKLLGDGCTDLELMDAEIADALNTGRPAPKFFGQELKITAKQRLQHRNKPPKTYWRVICQGVAQTWWFCLGIVCLACYEAYSGNSVSALLCGFGLAAWLGFLITSGLPSIYFRKLLKALDWSRWPEVLELVERLELINRFHFNQAHPFFLARSRAQALAGLGNLTEAVAVFAPWENRPGCPGWMYQMLKASIYDTAKQHDQALECTRKSIAEKPTAAAWLDLSNRFARYKKDAVQARAALVEAEKITLTSVEEAYHLRCRGIVAWVEGDCRSAKKELEASLAMMEKTRHVPFRDGHISIAKAYLGCALARLGDLAGAKHCFAEARKYLEATEETELLKECRKVIGEPHS